MACAGSAASFSCLAGGTNFTYQWQVSNGAPFTDIPGATSAIYTIDPVSINMNGNQYHVIIASACGYVVSDMVHLTVVDAPVITIQPPSSTSVCSGSNATLAITVTGANVQYQWEYSNAGCAGPYTNIPGATSSTLTTTAITTTGYYRCRIDNGCGGAPIYSDCATITVDATLNITTQPVNQSVCSGSDVTFTVAASSGSATYQWEVGGGGCAGSFSAIGGANSPSLTLTGVTTAQNNVAYRCMISSACAASINSDCAVLTVNDLDITTQPVDQTVCEGATAVFSVATSGSGVSYQWQVSTDGIIFNDIVGATTSTLSIPNVTSLEDGNLYRVLLTNSSCPNSNVSNTVILNVGQPTYIAAQPGDVTTCENSTFEFMVTAYQATFQWQVNTGFGWNDLTGETNDLLFLTATAAMNGNQYRVLVTGISCPTTLTSNGVTLTVYSTPVVTITSNPANPSLLPGQTATLTATPTQPGTYSYTWQLDGIDIPGANSNTHVVDYDHAAADYTATVTSQPGNCIGVSNTIHVTDAITGLRMQVYSNPNNGIFTIVYPGLPAGSSVEILDSHGQRAYSRTNLAANLPIYVDMHAKASGIYIIVINNGGAERLATERVVIIH
ncbi:MAG: T9SS type A sorting domain-containing protein [Ferruginibacter sp.]